MRYRFVQVTPSRVWVSAGVFDDSFDTIAANVIRGHVHGQPRAAISVDDHHVIFALDAQGSAMPPGNFNVDCSLAA